MKGVEARVFESGYSERTAMKVDCTSSWSVCKWLLDCKCVCVCVCVCAHTHTYTHTHTHTLLMYLNLRIRSWQRQGKEGISNPVYHPLHQKKLRFERSTVCTAGKQTYVTKEQNTSGNTKFVFEDNIFHFCVFLHRTFNIMIKYKPSKWAFSKLIF